MRSILRTSFVTMFAAGLLPACYLHAQSISFNLDKKVIYSDSLNLPYQTTISTVLTMMPELLQRPGDVFYSNYDIKVDGMSVSDASDVALSQLDLQDVEKIEITESSTSSYQKNGQGGSINLTLRKRDLKEHSRWGSASIDLSYPVSVAPQLHLGYRSKKFYVSALALSDIYNNSNTSESLRFEHDKLQSRSTEAYRERYRSQLANVLMEYRPTRADMFKVKLSESYVYGHELTTPDYNDDIANSYVYKNSTLNAAAAYTHSFSRSSLQMEVSYKYTPNNVHDYTPEDLDLTQKSNRHTVGGKLIYSADLLSATNPNKLRLSVGNNYNLNFSDEKIDSELLGDRSTGQKERLTPENRTDYVQPFVAVEGTFGKFKMKVQGEYQHFSYDLSKNNEQFDTHRDDFTGQTILEWHISNTRTFRLLGERALKRPSENQLFPITLFSPADGIYVRGNADLTPVLTHGIRVDYISDQQWGNHHLHYDTNVSYKHVNDMIESMVVNQQEGGGGLGLAQSYKTYLNRGKADIVSSNVMALYSYKTVSVTLTANLFHNKQHTGKGVDHYTYYNVSLCPHFTLKEGWQGSFGLTYNSSVETESRRLSDCTQASTIIGKRWNSLYIYCFSKLALQKSAEDITWKGDIRDVRKYEMLPNSAGIGLNYIF